MMNKTIFLVLTLALGLIFWPGTTSAILDDTPPTNDGLVSVTVDSATQITIESNSGSDVGYALSFSGSDIVIGPSSNDITGDNLQTITFSTWVKHNYAGDNGYIASLKRSAGNSTLISLDAGNSGPGNLGYLTRAFNNSSHYWMNYDGGYNDGSWHHLVAVVNGLDRSLYIDGELKSSDAHGIQSVTGNTAPFALGGFYFGSLYFTGTISNVAIWKKALSAPEISDIFNNGVNPGSETDLELFWSLDENTGTVTHDTADSHDGTITGATWVDGLSSGLNTTPYYYDATGNPDHNSGWQASTTYIDTGLTPNTEYAYKVNIRDAAENESGYSSELTARTLAAIPVSGTFGDVGDESITISWNANSNPSGTEYYIENQSADINSGWQTGVSWVSGGLNTDTSYTFRVKARSADGIETNWYDIGTQSTSAEPDVSPTPTPTPSSTPTPSPTPTPSTEDDEEGDTPIPVPEPDGPAVEAPYVAPRAAEESIGSPGTTTAELSVIGGTWPLIPIKPTPGDTTPPRLELTQAPERVIAGANFSLAAQTIDDQGEITGVIEYLGYSLDNGTSWHPVTTVEGLGEQTASFTIDSFPLPDKDYEILLRSRDNSGNETTLNPITVTIDQEDPQIVSLAVQAGAQELASQSVNQISIPAHSRFQLIGTFTGGPNKVILDIGNQEFEFTPTASGEYWTAQISLDEPGDFIGHLKAIDGAGNTLDEEIFTFVALPPLQIKIMGGSEVVIYEFNNSASDWQIFNAAAFGEKNPVGINRLNRGGLVLPTGKYYLQAPSVNSFLGPSAFSNIFHLNETSPIFGEWGNIQAVNTLEPLADELLPSTKSVQGIKTESGFEISTMMHDDVILFNFNPRSASALEQLFVYNQLLKQSLQDTVVIAVTPEIYREQIQAMKERGGLDIHFIFDKERTIQKDLFQYLSPATLFIDRYGEPITIHSGFLDPEKIQIILKQL